MGCSSSKEKSPSGGGMESPSGQKPASKMEPAMDSNREPKMESQMSGQPGEAPPSNNASGEENSMEHDTMNDKTTEGHEEGDMKESADKQPMDAMSAQNSPPASAEGQDPSHQASMAGSEGVAENSSFPEEDMKSEPAMAHPEAAAVVASPREMNTPPGVMDSTAFVESKMDGCYLVYEEHDHGTFYAKYSKTVISGALAFASLGEYSTIAPFKYKKPVVIQPRVRMGKTSYFQAWCQWIKEAKILEGEFVLLPTLEEMTEHDPNGFPAMSIFLLSGAKLTKIEKGLKNKPYKLKFADAVACVPESFHGLDDGIKSGVEMDRSEFLTKARMPQDKFYIEFK